MGVECEFVACCSTLPSRVEGPLRESIISVLREPRISRLILNYPWWCNRLSQPYPEPPEWLAQESRVTVHRCDDMGPMTKFAPALELLRDDTAIVLFDDDHVYPEGWFAPLCEKFQQRAEQGKRPRAFGRHGSLSRTKPFQTSRFNSGEREESVCNLSSAWGAIYPRGVLQMPELMRKLNRYRNKGLSSNDDMLLASAAFSHHVALHLVPTSVSERQRWAEANARIEDDAVSLARTANSEAQQMRLAMAMMRCGDYPAPWPETALVVSLLALFLALFCTASAVIALKSQRVAK